MRGENYGNHLTINHHIWHRIVSDDEVTDEDDRDLDEFFFEEESRRITRLLR